MPNVLMSLRSRDHGQTTVEWMFALMLGATIAVVAINWLRESGALADLFGKVIDQLVGQV